MERRHQGFGSILDFHLLLLSNIIMLYIMYRGSSYSCMILQVLDELSEIIMEDRGDKYEGFSIGDTANAWVGPSFHNYFGGNLS